VLPNGGAPGAPNAPAGAGGAGSAPGAPWNRSLGDTGAQEGEVTAQGGVSGQVAAPVAAPAEGAATHGESVTVDAGAIGTPVSTEVQGVTGSAGAGMTAPATTWFMLPVPQAVTAFRGAVAQLPATGAGAALLGLFSLLSLLAGGALVRTTRRRRK
jgi:LPXTG-motif cell wall-anchored protein